MDELFSVLSLSLVLGGVGRVFYAGQADFVDGCMGGFKSPWVTKEVETAVCTLRAKKKRKENRKLTD